MPRPSGQASTFRPPPPPPPRPQTYQAAAPSVVKRQGFSAAPSAPQAPSPQSYEPYGKVSVPASSYSGVSYRNTGFNQQNQSSYVLPSKPRDDNIRRSKGQSKMSGQPHYSHNTAALSLLLPSLASILWWHDSIIVLQIFLFVALGLYALDLINSRDGVAVGVWIGALSMTIASAYGTLLQADDLNASGMSMINFLLQLAVEGMSFCTWVSRIAIRIYFSASQSHLNSSSNHFKFTTGLLDHAAISMAS